MNRPIIKGTANHKASIAKAKAESIVSQRRTQADAGLVSAADTLGKSYKPQAIDYSIKQKGIDFLDIKKEKKKEKKVKVKKEKGENIFEKGYKGIRDFIKEKNQNKLNKRLRKAEEGPDSDYDFSELDKEPGLDAIKTEKYKSPEAGTKESEELLSRTKASRNKALQEAAKKHNVKVEDLEAKEIDGKKEFFPKQGAVGGGYGGEGGGAGSGGTQWDDELGRFRIPSGGISDEKYDSLSDEEKNVYDVEIEKRAKKLAAEAESLKPKQDNIKPEDLGDLPSMVNSGDIALDPVTNQYEYTEQYIKRNQPKVVKPVVEEKKTLSNLEIRKKRMRDRKYNDPNTSQYIKDQMLKEGYVPNESKSPTQMRDNRIYRNAVKGGAVQRNMIKSGYKPE